MNSKKKVFTKIFTSTKFSFFGLALLLVASCNSSGKRIDEPNQEKTERSKLLKPQSTEKRTDSNIVAFLQALPEKELNKKFTIETKFGNIEVELFTNTPLHLRNFNFLVDTGYYNNTWFYRVSPNHVIQAGNTDSRSTTKKRRSIGYYTLPAEELNTNPHVTGVLAAARTYKNNPGKRTDPFEFYIVVGKKYTEGQLTAMAKEYGFNLTPERRSLYSEIGGAPHLDGEHTVFGRVTKGMDVVRTINQQETDEGEWPLKNIPIKIISE